jgi:hypothetical protein
MTALIAAVILAWLAIILLAFAMAGILKQMHALAVGPDRSVPLGPRIGIQAPLREELQLQPAASAILLFTSPTCDTCNALIANLPVDLIPAGWQLNVISRESVDIPRDGRVNPIPDAAKAFDAYAIRSTPYAVSIDDGVITGATYAGSIALFREFVARSVALPAGRT